MTKTITKKLCPTCRIEATFTEKDKAFNTGRLKELAEIHKSTDVFAFRFRGNCKTCGVIFIEQNITNVRF